MKSMNTYRRYEALRNERGLRNADISRKTGIPPSVLCDWKMGRYQLKYDKMSLIARALELPVSELYAE